jgi:ankyrin repeat protein
VRSPVIIFKPVWLLLGILVLTNGSATAAGVEHQLADAAERRDRVALERLLKQKVDVNAPQPDGATALHWAAHWDDLDAVDRLLRAGADVNAANDHRVTPLALACENGSIPIVEKLLLARADANASISSGETALMTASRTGNLRVVQALLSHGATVNATEPSHNQTALMWAIAEQHPDIVQALLEHGADVKARSRVRHRTVQTGDRYGDQNSIKQISEIDLGGFTPLLFAARVGDRASAEHLLRIGADVNDRAPNGASALVIAAHSGHGTVAQLLLDKGANANAADAGYSALHAAVLLGDVDLAKALLAHQADPNAKLVKGTPSRYYSKDYAFNEGLVGATPLLLAARYGESEMMRLLAAGGADGGVTLPDGTTTLMATIGAARGFGAFRAGDRRERYQGPADVAAKPDDEDERVAFETAKRAIELGADVRAANKNGDTALHLAATLGLNSVVQLLADSGANLEAKNSRGQTPLAILTPAPAGTQSVQFLRPADQYKSTAALLRTLGAKQ